MIVHMGDDPRASLDQGITAVEELERMTAVEDVPDDIVVQSIKNIIQYLEDNLSRDDSDDSDDNDIQGESQEALLADGENILPSSHTVDWLEDLEVT